MKPDNIMGGMFGLETISTKQRTTPPFKTDTSILLVNARSCISLIVNHLSPRRIWLPSYLCGDILLAINDPSMINYYEIDSDLRIKDHSWVDDLSESDLVIVINYFGFKNDEKFLQAIKGKNAWVVEDACQSMLTAGLGENSDYVIFSPRKFIGVPDGGVLSISADQTISVDQLIDPPEYWWLNALQASIARGIFDRCGGNRDWFAAFQKAEKESPVGNFRMSDLSRLVIENLVDYEEISIKRKRNYRYLLESIGEYAVFKDLPPEIVPLGFPIRLSNRDQVKEIFYKNNIYPPVHWNINGFVPLEYEESHFLSSRILTLICDQRYDLTQMERMAEVIKKHGK